MLKCSSNNKEVGAHRFPNNNRLKNSQQRGENHDKKGVLRAFVARSDKKVGPIAAQ